MREQLGHFLRGRRDDEHRPPGVLMLPGHVQHLVIEAGQHSGHDVRREPLEVHDAGAGQRLEHAVAQLRRAFVGRAREPEPHVRPHVARQLAAAHHAVAIGGARELERARALHQRLVEVEEGRGLPAAAIDRHRVKPR